MLNSYVNIPFQLTNNWLQMLQALENLFGYVI
jgi:hypothetical protein